MLRSITLSSLLKSARSHAEAGPPTHGPSEARIAAALRSFHDGGHRAIRILDLECGNGARLLNAAARARALGFVSVEGRGASLSAANIRHARHQAARQPHPSTDLQFAICDPIGLLASEHDGASDLVLLSASKPYPVSPLGTALERVCIGEILCAE